MKAVAIVLLLAACVSAISPDNDDYVVVPGGRMMHRSCIFPIPEGATIVSSSAEDGVLAVDDVSGEEYYFPPCAHEPIEVKDAARSSGARTPTPTYNGYLEQAAANNKNGFSALDGYWTVPENPSTQTNQVLYFVLGTYSTKGQLYAAVQWGSQGVAGTGPFWILNVWYLTALTGHYGKTVPCSPGDSISALMMQEQSVGSNNFNITAYNLSTGQSSSTTVTYDTAKAQTDAIVAIEAYRLAECSQLPASESVFYNDLSVEVGGYPTATTWQPNSYSHECDAQAYVNSTNSAILTYNSGIHISSPCDCYQPSNGTSCRGFYVIGEWDERNQLTSACPIVTFDIDTSKAAANQSIIASIFLPDYNDNIMLVLGFNSDSNTTSEYYGSNPASLCPIYDNSNGTGAYITVSSNATLLGQVPFYFYVEFSDNGCGEVPSPPSACQTWSEMAPMPTSREYAASSAVDGIIYAMGGTYDFSSAFATVEAYDPSSDTWAEVAPMPTARFQLASSTVNGIIYAIGGGSYGSAVLNSVEAYDPSSNTWKGLAPMPTGRASLTSSAVDGIIYCIGGRDQYGNALYTVEAYDPSTNTWTRVAPLTTGRFGLTSSMVDNIIFAIGGINAENTYYNGTLTEVPAIFVEAYDPSTNIWTSMTTFPTRAYSGASVVDGIIYITSGFSTYYYNSLDVFSTNSAEAFNPSSDVWTEIAPMPYPSAGSCTSSTANGVLYAMGQYYNFAYTPPPMCSPKPRYIQPYDASASSYTSTAYPENAIDNNTTSQWNAGGYAPAWIDFYIPTSTLYQLRWMDGVNPSPTTVDLEIYVGSQANDTSLIFSKSYTATTLTYQEFDLEQPVPDVSYIRFNRVEPAAGGSWVSYPEIYPYGVQNN